VHARKKEWAKPAVEQLELARARDLIVQAIQLLGDDQPASAELRGILESIDAKLTSR